MPRTLAPSKTLSRIVMAALVTLAGSAPAHAVLLAVDLRTNYLPYDEFVRVDTALVFTFPTPSIVRRRSDLIGADFIRGERVAELDVSGDRTYRVRITLYGRGGLVMAQRDTLVSIGGGTHAFTMLMVRPAPRHKTVRLIDRNGDGVANPDDWLLYEVDTVGGVRFEDTPGPGSRLIAGSVSTTSGTVTDGNGAGDRSVVVTNPGIVSFVAEVLAPAIANQGRVFDGSGTRLTDDPATAVTSDATVTTVSCTR